MIGMNMPVMKNHQKFGKTIEDKICKFIMVIFVLEDNTSMLDCLLLGNCLTMPFECLNH